MELPVKLPLAGVPDALPKDCQATYSRDRLSNTRVPPSSSSFSPRYRLTSIGAENLIPWSREIDTKVASVAGPIEEIQETAKGPSGETARDGTEAIETSGGGTAGPRLRPSQDSGRRCRRRRRCRRQCRAVRHRRLCR